MNVLILFVKFLLLFKIVSTNILMDSTSVEMRTPFRKNKCYKSSEEQQERFLEMTKTPYTRFNRPGDTNSSINVNVSLEMTSLSSLDDLSSEYSISLRMELEWFDDRLSHECNQVVMSLRVKDHTRIWLPTLTVPQVKEAESTQLDGSENVESFRLGSDGYVFIKSRFQLNLFCVLNFKHFPFDVQKCSVKLEVRGYSDEELVIKWREENPFKNSDKFHMNGFTLIDYELVNDSVKSSFQSELFDDQLVSRIIVVLHLKREWYHFLLEVYIPTGLFVTISWLSFWLEITAAPARVTLGMTTMLTLVTSSLSTREKLPKVKYIHALDVWISVCIGFVFLSLIEFALVSYLYRYQNTRQKRFKSSAKDMSTVDALVSHKSYSNLCQYLDIPEIYKNPMNAKIPDLRLKANKCSINGRNSSFSRKGFNCPNDLADSIDRKCRLLFPLCFALFSLIYWLWI